jgi:hypothetical protein
LILRERVLRQYVWGIQLWPQNSDFTALQHKLDQLTVTRSRQENALKEAKETADYKIRTASSSSSSSSTNGSNDKNKNKKRQVILLEPPLETDVPKKKPRRIGTRAATKAD